MRSSTPRSTFAGRGSLLISSTKELGVDVTGRLASAGSISSWRSLGVLLIGSWEWDSGAWPAVPAVSANGAMRWGRALPRRRAAGYPRPSYVFRARQERLASHYKDARVALEASTLSRVTCRRRAYGATLNRIASVNPIALGAGKPLSRLMNCP